MTSYYAEHLSAERLRKCYEIAPPRVRQYLTAELAFVLNRLRATDVVLELGCGYGRVLKDLATKAHLAVGIDSSAASVQLGRELLRDVPNCQLLQMDAASLGFRERAFDVVMCIQNGVSAFKVDPQRLLSECLRITRPGGRVLLSSYAAKFWPHRLEWFRLQAEHGLLGEIDWTASRDGVIVCKGGFKATTVPTGSVPWPPPLACNVRSERLTNRASSAKSSSKPALRCSRAHRSVRRELRNSDLAARTAPPSLPTRSRSATRPRARRAGRDCLEDRGKRQPTRCRPPHRAAAFSREPERVCAPRAALP